jgi:hypothetical protein
LVVVELDMVTTLPRVNPECSGGGGSICIELSYIFKEKKVADEA